jgi:hypothetical protein
MFQALGSIVKYSGLVLLILVLSHIVEIKGVTISQHVENGLNHLSGGRHSSHVHVTQQFSSAQQQVIHEDADGFSNEDRNKLNAVIQNHSRRR